MSKRKTVEEITPKKIAKKTEESTPNSTKKEDQEKGETKPTLEELSRKTVDQLKDLCRSQGLKVGGNKTQLLMRLTGQEPEKEKKPKAQKSSRKGIETFVQKMKDLGVKDPCNYCLLVGIKKGFYSLDGDHPLENVVCKSQCVECSEEFEVKIKDVAEQTCYPGTDYEDGAESATFSCPKCKANQYVTRLCEGRPSYDSGKFHNHCTECSGGGKCIGDYREAHCGKCGKHYFSGLSGLPCPCEEKGGRGGRGGRGQKDCIIA